MQQRSKFHRACSLWCSLTARLSSAEDGCRAGLRPAAGARLQPDRGPAAGKPPPSAAASSAFPTRGRSAPSPVRSSAGRGRGPVRGRLRRGETPRQDGRARRSPGRGAPRQLPARPRSQVRGPGPPHTPPLPGRGARAGLGDGGARNRGPGPRRRAMAAAPAGLPGPAGYRGPPLPTGSAGREAAAGWEAPPGLGIPLPAHWEKNSPGAAGPARPGARQGGTAPLVGGSGEESGFPGAPSPHGGVTRPRFVLCGILIFLPAGGIQHRGSSPTGRGAGTVCSVTPLPWSGAGGRNEPTSTSEFLGLLLGLPTFYSHLVAFLFSLSHHYLQQTQRYGELLVKITFQGIYSLLKNQYRLPPLLLGIE